MRCVTAEEMRALDRLTIEEYGTPGHVLMERAGRGATEVFLREFPAARRARTLVVAGRGNNGGDGFVIARRLRAARCRCEVVLMARRADVRGDAARNLQALGRGRVRVREAAGQDGMEVLGEALARADFVVDALLGTGLSDPPRGPIAAAIDLINASGRPVLAVDVPSGLDASRGVAPGSAIQAEVTATFSFPKLGLLLYPGAALAGHVAVVDIGIAREALSRVPTSAEVLTADEVGWLVPVRDAEAHKGGCGHLLAIAGSRGKTGAAILCCRGALRAGAGLVTLGCAESLNPIFETSLLEAMTAPVPDGGRGTLSVESEGAWEGLLAGRQAVVVGPGLSVTGETISLVRWVLAHATVPAVVDADGLNCLAAAPETWEAVRAPLVLTPHPGEMARLLGTSPPAVQSDRLGAARTLARHRGCVVVLKGARTVVAEPGGVAHINPTGNPGLASGGTGDVLAGLIGGLIAQGLSPLDAARLGVYAHGRAADRLAERRGTIGLIASDLLDELPAVLASLGAEAYAGG